MATSATYPLRMEAELDTGLSRWLWLVKWLLSIPHFVVLGFLWIAYGVLTVLAFFAILFTGRYPRSMFEFNVGVIRWTWRVSYYSFGVNGTDRYPPFTLAEVPDYPTHLDIEYPERLSRGLVLVKWLLAIPHLVIASILAGGGTWFGWYFGVDNVATWGNLIGLLVLIAVVILAVTGSYPRGLFDLILGLNRWVLRVAAYVGLMTDRYPPFRLDMGGREPGTLTIPRPPEGGPAGPPPTPARPDLVSGRRGGWTGGRVTAVVVGSILGLTSLGLLAGGGVGLWADRTQRDGGFVTMGRQTYSTGSYALTTERIDVEEGQYWFFPRGILDRVRVQISPNTAGTAVFVGIGPTQDVGRYLTGVGRAIVTDPAAPTYRVVQGDGPASEPTAQGFWARSSAGRGTQTLVWPVARGSWTVVVMNADRSRGVDVSGELAATVPWLFRLAVGALIAGALLLAGGVALIVLAIRRASIAA